MPNLLDTSSHSGVSEALTKTQTHADTPPCKLIVSGIGLPMLGVFRIQCIVDVVDALLFKVGDEPWLSKLLCFDLART